jgi:hypothetical protein
MNSARRGRSLAEVMAPLDEEAPPQAEAAPVAATTAASTRQTIVPINILVTPEDRRRLRQLSLDTNLSLQKLGHEAWNLLLQSRGLPPLTPVAANVPSGRMRPR